MFSSSFYHKWFGIGIILMIFMIGLGGVTRLTDSGLSMVEWKPASLLPPMSEIEWISEYNNYKGSLEYKDKIKGNKSLEEFKVIYYYEFFHRITGRIIFLYFLIPFLFLSLLSINRKKIFNINIHPLLKAEFLSLIFLILLIAVQGLIGWYMVQSGLIGVPEVSHFRLSLHLMTALLLLSFTYLLYLISDYSKKIFNLFISKSFIYVILFIIIIQIMYGAFTAGLNGAAAYNTFPFLDIPRGLYVDFIIMKLFSNAYIVQFIHRVIGFILFFLSIYLIIKSYMIKKILFFKQPEGQFGILILVQFILGLLTLHYQPQNIKIIAIMHQINGSIILLSCIRIIYYLHTPNNK